MEQTRKCYGQNDGLKRAQEIWSGHESVMDRMTD